MIQKNARLFALGHIMVPTVLVLLYFARINQPMILILAALTLCWCLLLTWRSFITKDLTDLLQSRAVWTIIGIDIALIAAVYTLPTWSAEMAPIWLILFLVPFYASEMELKYSIPFCLLGLLDIYVYTVFQHTHQFLSMDTLLIVAGMIIFMFFLGRNTHILTRLAHYDPLTNLPNRDLFRQRLRQEIHQANGPDSLIGVLFIDLDNFKYVNDTIGHAAGDELLIDIASRIRHCLPNQAVLSRMGGDEFNVYLTRLDSEEDAELIAQTILKIMRSPIIVNQHEVFVTCSIGISFYPKDGTDPDVLMKNAESAMYSAKELGRNNYQVYTTPYNEMPYERLTMETMLRKALENDAIEVYYQPRVDALTEHIVCVEALARWNHPDLGLVMPKDFIPLAEDTGLITILGKNILRKACRQVKQWHNEGYPNIRVSVNLSPKQFKEQDLPDTIEQVLHDTGLDPSYLELEVTESAAMQNINFTIILLRILKDMGVKISIDDFGVGYSSLSYLKKLPIDALKIDQSFIRNIENDHDNAAIVSAIIALSQKLGLHVTAEGVETKLQLEYLQSQGCDEIQGFLFGKPMPPETLEEWMQLRSRLHDLIL